MLCVVQHQIVLGRMFLGAHKFVSVLYDTRSGIPSWSGFFAYRAGVAIDRPVLFMGKDLRQKHNNFNSHLTHLV